MGKALNGTYIVKASNGYGYEEAELLIEDGYAELTWYGDGGEEVSQESITMEDAEHLLETQDAVETDDSDVA